MAIYGKIANYASCGYHLPIIGWSNPAICCTFIASYSTASKTYKLVGCKHDVNHKTTLGLAVKMLEIWVCHTKHKRSIKKLGLSYKRSEIDMVLACNRALLHHMCLGFSAIQPYRSGLQVQIFWSRENATPTWKGAGREFMPLAICVQLVFYPCSPLFQNMGWNPLELVRIKYSFAMFGLAFGHPWLVNWTEDPPQ